MSPTGKAANGETRRPRVPSAAWLALALVGAVALVVDVVVGPVVALGAVVVVSLLILGLWVALPWMLLRRHEDDGPPRY